MPNIEDYDYYAIQWDSEVVEGVKFERGVDPKAWCDAITKQPWVDNLTGSKTHRTSYIIRKLELV